MKNEIRLLVKVKKFDKIKSKQHFQKTVWFFKDSKITKIDNKYQKVMLKDFGKVKKNIEMIPTQDALDAIDSWDRLCLYKCIINAKFPIVNDTKLYIEQIKVIPNKGRDFIFYSTEAETEEQLKNKELLEVIPGIKIIKNLGEVSVFEILENGLWK